MFEAVQPEQFGIVDIVVGPKPDGCQLLARLLDRSTDARPIFAQYVISDEDRRRAGFMLEGEILAG
jgi:hypothetical protein